MSHSTIPEYLTGLENRYRLSRFCILDTVERVMAEVLETRYRGESIRVSIDPRSLDVAITGYSQTQGGHQRDLSLSRLTGMKNLLRRRGDGFRQLQTVTMAKTIEATGKHRVQEGLVRRVTANGSLWVEVNTLEAGISVTGWCPVGNLIPREIGMVRPGQVLMFSLKKVNTVPIDGLLRSCGPVYTVLMAAARPGMNAQSPLQGFLSDAVLMLAFGIGTFPSLFLVGRLTGVGWIRSRLLIYKISSVLMVLVGIYFIIQGIRY